MAGRTDIAVYSGWIAAPTGGILAQSFVGVLSGWVSFPIGAVLGFVVVFIAVELLGSVAGPLLRRNDPTCANDDERPPSAPGNLCSLCKISLACSFLSLLACCGSLLYEHLFGHREPATPRVDMAAMALLSCLYVIVLLIPSWLVLRSSSTVGLFCMCGLNFSGTLATVVGFASLLF